MSTSQQLRVWPGERLLLPIENAAAAYLLRCVQGEGYLRIMSCAQRQLIVRGAQKRIAGGEIATLTGKKAMLIELKKLS